MYLHITIQKESTVRCRMILVPLNDKMNPMHDTHDNDYRLELYDVEILFTLSLKSCMTS